MQRQQFIIIFLHVFLYIEDVNCCGDAPIAPLAQLSSNVESQIESREKLLYHGGITIAVSFRDKGNSLSLWCIKVTIIAELANSKLRSHGRHGFRPLVVYDSSSL